MATQTQTQDVIRPLPKIDPYNGPNYQGFVFTLYSSSGKPTHYLTIATQTAEVFFAQAYITGYWQGDGGTPKPVAGLITGNGDGISCSWSTPNGKNVLEGALTYSVGKFGVTSGLAWPSAYLDGNVTAYDANGNVLQGMGPGHVYGEGGRPWVAVEA